MNGVSPSDFSATGSAPHIHSLSSLGPFDYASRTRLIFGPGAVNQLGEAARSCGGKRVLVVTDPGLVKAGHAGRIGDNLKSAGLEFMCFDQVRENPTTRDVERCLSTAKSFQADLLVGLGGGSAMDTAKGCNFLLTNGGRMQDYWGVGKATQPMLPFIAIPTTAGTGSECQSAALIADETSHHKMACLDQKAMARIAILDPELTVSQPRHVTAHTGIDALAHALETAVTKKRNHMSLLFSHGAFDLTVRNLAEVLSNPKDLAARGHMLLGASLAGIAIENSMLGAAHAAANPLTAHFGIVHGEAVGIMLPAVVRFNAADPLTREAYAALAARLPRDTPGDDRFSPIERLVRKIEALLNVAQVARSLADLNVDQASVTMLAKEAAGQWTAQFNPRTVSAADFEALYTSAFEPRSV